MTRKRQAKKAYKPRKNTGGRSKSKPVRKAKRSPKKFTKRQIKQYVELVSSGSEEE